MSAVRRLCLAGLAALGVAHAAWAAGGPAASVSAITPAITPAKPGTQCVEPAEVMRRNHMRYLQHQRDLTVHGGVRGAKHSLKDCVDCHAGAESNSVASRPTDFCISCHQYAAVKIDCFECHSSQPRSHGLAPLKGAAASPARLATPAAASAVSKGAP